jgi:nitroreductase
MDFIERMQWRYATKRMDPTQRVPEATVERILEAARLAPTSNGLQPFEVWVVTNPEIKARLSEAAFGQTQVKDGSHVLVFAAWDTYTAERINGWFDFLASERGGPNPGTEAYRKRLLETYVSRDAEINHTHAAKQAYLALGFAMSAAAIEGVDSVPMEGFDYAKVDEILGLRAKGLRVAAMLPLGHRDEANDWLLKQKKVRRPRAAFVTELK